ncbi:MAG TPA: nucleotidyltransferase domain-containing protein [archaeon]|nr:nucleotidyltransferase domain-containing protein [archaeon]
MVRKEALKNKLKSFRENVNKEIKIEKMILFGSMASGKTHADSDVDLIIVSPDFREMNFFKRGAKMYDYWDIRRPVDFLCYTPEEFKKLSGQVSIVSEALKEGIEIN